MSSSVRNRAARPAAPSVRPAEAKAASAPSSSSSAWPRAAEAVVVCLSLVPLAMSLSRVFAGSAAAGGEAGLLASAMAPDTRATVVLALLAASLPASSVVAGRGWSAHRSAACSLARVSLLWSLYAVALAASAADFLARGAGAETNDALPLLASAAGLCAQLLAHRMSPGGAAQARGGLTLPGAVPLTAVAAAGVVGWLAAVVMAPELADRPSLSHLPSWARLQSPLSPRGWSAVLVAATFLCTLSTWARWSLDSGKTGARRRCALASAASAAGAVGWACVVAACLGLSDLALVGAGAALAAHFLALLSKAALSAPRLLPSGPVPPAASSLPAVWGRESKVGGFGALLSVFMMVASPLFVVYVWMSLDSFGGSLAGLRVMLAWLAFQVALMVFMPGPIDHGQLTPAGHRLPYRVNGLRAWFASHAAFLLGSCYLGWFSPTVVYDHWGSIFVWANVLGFSLTLAAYAKARLSPTHADDVKLSGSVAYDIFMGAELNPRIGEWFDFKLFFNGRPGIIGWSIINLSFAFQQHQASGLTASMVCLLVLHNVYVLDFFWNEGWYLRTIDIAHDHFGFYLAWGDTVWLPYLYTLQSHYLVRNPTQLPPLAVAAIYALGAAGYFVFRSVNHQKDYCRAADGKCQVWGRPCEFVRAEYRQKDGTVRSSILLCSGWWGLSRHFNYVGDLLMSLAFCLTCGFGHVLPYFYIVYMTILLVHRVFRDESRCSGKYGAKWDEYCARVPYRIVPGVF